MASPKRNLKPISRSRIRSGTVLVFALALIALGYIFPNQLNAGFRKLNTSTGIGLPEVPSTPFHLGLDLQGGAHLIYEAKTNDVPPENQADAVEAVRDVIERRVNAFGVGEANIQTSKVADTYRVIVELPGVTDVNAAIKMIGETPILEFKEVNDEPPRDLNDEEKKQITDTNAKAKKIGTDLLKNIKTKEAFDSATLSNTDNIKVTREDLGFIEAEGPFKAIYDWAKTSKEGDVSRTILESDDAFNIAKRGVEEAGPQEVKASHILICYLGARNCATEMSKEDALKKAEELKAKATTKNFVTLAKENSTEPGAEQTGGDLGYFPKEGEGAMVEEFGNAAFAAKTGEIVGPIETAFGFHVIYKQDERQQMKYSVSRIAIDKLTADEVLPPPAEWKDTGLTGKQLKKAEVGQHPQTGEVLVIVNFNEEGTTLFREITERNLQKPLGIFLDGQLLGNPPIVQQVIPSGEATISGSFNILSARELSRNLNIGALPVPVELISQQTIGPSLGAESLQKSLKAGIVGVLVVILFLIFYYRLPGIIAALSLVLYVLLLLAVFKFIPVTLTLAGIAGFILSVGMAVDANVLIYERLKEELALGKSFRLSVQEAFIRAWPSIRDGNVSNLITCFLLMWFGNSFVQGFAITLIIGIFISIFSAMMANRVLMYLIVPWFSEAGNWLVLKKKQL